MTFETIFEQVVDLLQRQRRVSYRALARRFEIDEAFIDDLKTELLYVYATCVETDEHGLWWTEDTEAVPELGQRRASISQSLEDDSQLRLDAVLAAVTAMLERDGRATYRLLKLACGLDDHLLGAVRDELIFTRKARDEAGQGLVWLKHEPRETSTAHPAILCP